MNVHHDEESKFNSQVHNITSSLDIETTIWNLDLELQSRNLRRKPQTENLETETLKKD
ncbi:mucin-17 X6, partial [Biomphalaria glabrata]